MMREAQKESIKMIVSHCRAGTWGALVKSGYRASGMAKMVSARFGRRTISQGDLDMRRFCCGLAGHCDDFLTRRPPNDCTDYVAPIRRELLPWQYIKMKLFPFSRLSLQRGVGETRT